MTFTQPMRATGLLALGLAVSTLLICPAPYVAPASAAGARTVVALPGYQVAIFARGTTAYSHPDSILTDGRHVFVGYQNVTAKDGTDNKSSTVVEYTLIGGVVGTFAVKGHNDGLRMDPATHQLWALSNEDGNPGLTIIDPKTGSETPYTFARTAHGGGFDDLVFINGKVVISASNPSLDKTGLNAFPALDQVTLGNGTATVTPVLMGNGAATDRIAHTKANLNLIDPDSLTTDLKGDLVLDNQAGSQLLFLSNVGTARQSVSSLPVGTQVDDTVWPSSARGRLLVTDTGTNSIYAISGAFLPGSAFSATPNDSGVAGMVAKLDTATGTLTPAVIGLSSPHGLAFVPAPWTPTL
jgi:hypothetical protein